jgi:BirA family biotin operon repressor/biotin-[acetyl-CoA-carboxylase] ligase
VQSRLDLKRVEQNLSTQKIGRAVGWKNELWDTIESTNTRAAELAAEGGPEGIIVMARQQTAGRGRLGRKWESPPDSGIYLSLLLRPSIPLAELSVITLAVGVAASTAIENATGIRAGLKWVNDLIYNGRKLGGILAEMPSMASSLQGLNQALVIGIGINVRLDENDLPDDLKEKIEWLERLTGLTLDPNVLVGELAKQLERSYNLLLEKQADTLLNEWRDRSVTLGKEVIATSGSKSLKGRAVDITGGGALILLSDDNQRHELHAGEVVIRGQDGSYS